MARGPAPPAGWEVSSRLPSEPRRVDAFLDDLRGEGRSDSEGRFTVDWARANAILAQHVLAEPEDCILKVIQAAVRAGAGWVRGEHVPEGLSLFFDRPQLTWEDLESLPAALLSPGAPLRDLAVALHSAVHSGWPLFHVCTPHGTIAGRRDAWVHRREETGPLHVTFRSVQGVRLGKVARRCPHPPLELELPYVTQSAYAHPIAELRHEGERRHLWLPASSARLLIKLPPEDDYPEMSVGLESDVGAARLWLSVAGVCRLHELPWKTPGVVALVSADHLTTDASGLRIVEDEAYQELLEDLGRETERLVRELRARLRGTPTRERLQLLRMGAL